MQLPLPGDYIDIHIHGGKPSPGIFMIESLMAHEENLPENLTGISFTYGIHPWFLNDSNQETLLERVTNLASHPAVKAIGEAGFDKLRGPSPELQQTVFEKQVVISEKVRKPVIIHCVKAWDELLAVKKKMKPEMPWMIHGFRGNTVMADQLISKGMYLSVWFEFAIRPESAGLLKHIPINRLFLETDGADIDIRKIYGKVAADIGVSVEELKSIMFSNFKGFFL